jgi:hypothetical protein
VGPRAGLDGCGNSRPHRDSIRGPSSPYRVAIPTALFRPTFFKIYSSITEFCGKLLIYRKISVQSQGNIEPRSKTHSFRKRNRCHRPLLSYDTFLWYVATLMYNVATLYLRLWYRVQYVSLMAAKVARKFSTFYGTRMFITMYKRALDLFNPFHSLTSHLFEIILILSSRWCVSYKRFLHFHSKTNHYTPTFGVFLLVCSEEIRKGFSDTRVPAVFHWDTWRERNRHSKAE